MQAETDLLPATFAERLNDEQRRTVAEAPRARRVIILSEILRVTEAEARIALAEATGLPITSDLKVDPAAVTILPARLVRDFHIAPLAVAGATEQQLHLATPWPPDQVMIDWIATFTSRHLHWHLAPAERIGQLILDHYGVGAGSLDDDEADSNLAASALATGADVEADEDAAVVRFVSDVITQAIEDGATDIHFEPQEGQLGIRYRVDGLLIPVPVPAKDFTVILPVRSPSLTTMPYGVTVWQPQPA